MPFVACDNGHTHTHTQTEARLRCTHARTWRAPIEVWTTGSLPPLVHFSATHCINFAVLRSCVAPVDLISHTRLGSPDVQVTPRGLCVVVVCVCVCVCELENKQKLLLRIYDNAHVVCHIVNQVNQAINNARCDNNNTTTLTPTHTRTRTTTSTHTQPHKQHTTRHLHGNSSSIVVLRIELLPPLCVTLDAATVARGQQCSISSRRTHFNFEYYRACWPVQYMCVPNRINTQPVGTRARLSSVQLSLFLFLFLFDCSSAWNYATN